jgi:hypothetical protein
MTLPAPGAPAAPARALALADATPSAIPEALRGELRPETGAEPARPLRTADAVAGVRTGALAGALVTGFLVADLGVALGLTGAGAGWPVPHRQLSIRRSRSSSLSFHRAKARNSRAYVAGIRRPGIHPKRRRRSISTG